MFTKLPKDLFLALSVLVVGFALLGNIRIFADSIKINKDILPYYESYEHVSDLSKGVLQLNHFGFEYGLFRRMTGIDGRPELVLQGSDDSTRWKAYDFHFKP